MLESRPLEVVFLTNFTDYCYRSIPAIAQMADDFAIRLTIAYAGAGNLRASEDKTKLERFFPEADAYPESRRLLMRGDLVDAVIRLSNSQPVDLLIAPAADPLGWPRIGHRSLRTRLLRQANLPLWTVGRPTRPSKLRCSPAKVGCWVDFHPGWQNHIAFAREYARATGASLHIFHALPEVHEGMHVQEGQPLFRDGVVEAVTQAIGPSPVAVHFHVADRDGRWSRAKLIDRSGVDVVFVSDVKWNLPAWLAPKPRLLNECVCPVVHVPVDTEVPVWRLIRESYAPVREVAMHEPVKAMVPHRGLSIAGY